MLRGGGIKSILEKHVLVKRIVFRGDGLVGLRIIHRSRKLHFLRHKTANVALYRYVVLLIVVKPARRQTLINTSETGSLHMT